MNQGYSPAELLAYQCQLALSKAAASGLSGQALMQMTGHGLAATSMGLSSGASQAAYDFRSTAHVLTLVPVQGCCRRPHPFFVFFYFYCWGSFSEM